MEDIKIDLYTDNNDYYSPESNGARVELCAIVIKEMFNVGEDSPPLTLLISENRTNGSYMIKLLNHGYVSFFKLLDIETPEMIQVTTGTREYFRVNHPEVLDKKVYVSILV